MIARRALLAAPVLGLRAAAPPFSASLWRSIEPLYAAILRHPFLTGLTDGSLPAARFQFYMLQDALYLGAYSKALAVLASKAPREEWAMFFTNSSLNCLNTEKKLHETYFQPDQLAKAEMAPVNAAYTNHLLASVYQHPFAEGVAAVLPCYWIYWEVGRELKKSGSKNPAYQRWIDQYSSDGYRDTVKRAVAIMDDAAADTGDSARARCLKLFERSSRYEYQFWDMAWRQERWLP